MVVIILGCCRWVVGSSSNSCPPAPTPPRTADLGLSIVVLSLNTQPQHYSAPDHPLWSFWLSRHLAIKALGVAIKAFGYQAFGIGISGRFGLSLWVTGWDVDYDDLGSVMITSRADWLHASPSILASLEDGIPGFASLCRDD